MSSPLSKKQETDNVKSPIVFSCPGQKPDVRLIVFDQEFHVHSVVLKMNSAFFRKFLDSADKVGAAETTDRVCTCNSALALPEASLVGLGSTSNLKYEWVTKIDGENSWFLVEDNPKNQPYELSTFEGNPEWETTVFEKLLRALYTQPYQLEDAEDLLLLTSLADYYRALPIVSRTLDGTLINSKTFCQKMQYHVTQLYPAAAKLRNALLFRECLVWIVSPYQIPQYHEIEDRQLRMIAKCVYGEISTRVTKVTSALLSRAAKDRSENAYEQSIVDLVLEPIRDTVYDTDVDGVRIEEDLDYPRWLREVHNNMCVGDVQLDFDSLMGSNLVLDNGISQAGAEGYEEYFLCASISDEDLPWDVHEMDW